MTGLLGLPTEIRLKIWEYCLVVGEINPYPAHYEARRFGKSSRRPDTALLRVHPAITEETREILYGKNTFTMSYVNKSVSRVFTAPTRHLIRHVKFDFTFRSIYDKVGLAEWGDYFKNNHNQADKATIRCELHILKLRALRERWYNVIWLLSSLDLTHLELDFESCYCSTGCCRLVTGRGQMLFQLINHHFLKAPGKAVKPPRNLKLTGLLDKAEEEYVVNRLWPAKIVTTRLDSISSSWDITISEMELERYKKHVHGLIWQVPTYSV